MDIPLTIKDTKEGLLKKKYSCVDLVDAYLNRIKTFDKDLNSVLTISDDLAYKQAKINDKLVENYSEKAFEQKPLLGVTVIHKDMYLTKGVRTTAGSKVLENYVPQYSATSVKRLEKAGCITLGKANQDAWAHGSSGENSDFGATKNPWNKEYVPGGSSSGSGASLASNFSLVTTGTDTCGSIRLPASYCGVVGFKPTYGSVSRYGIVAMASSLDSIGHFTHSVADSRKVLNVTAGIDKKDATLAEKSIKGDVKGITIGIADEFMSEGVDKEVVKNIESVIKELKKKGIKFKNVSLPHTKYGISVYYIIQPAEVSSNLGRYDGVRYGNDRSSFGDEAKRRIMLGSYVLSAGYYDAYYLKAMKVRTIIKEEIENVFEDVDAIIAPVAPTAPFKLGEKVDDPLKMYLTDVFAATANLSGIPAIAIPSGFNNDKLPLGFQLMGPRFSENILFSLGELYEEIIDWKPKVATLG